MGGGAWPFLVGGVICLVNSDNERDSDLLNRRITTSQRPTGHSGLVFLMPFASSPNVLCVRVRSTPFVVVFRARHLQSWGIGVAVPRASCSSVFHVRFLLSAFN